MRVKATQEGYYGNQLRPAGSVFDLVPYKGNKPMFDKDGKAVMVGKVQKIEKDHLFTADEQFSTKWMEKVSDGVPAGTVDNRISKTPLKDEKNGKPLPPQHGEIEMPSDKDVI